MRELTEQEAHVIKASAYLWNEFLQLPVIHPDDINDVRFHLNAIQSILIARPYVEQLGIKTKL